MSLWIKSLGRAQVGWRTLFHVVLARFTHAFRVTCQVSSGPDGPGRCQPYAWWLSGRPRFSYLCPLHPGCWGMFLCTEHLLSVGTEEVPWHPNLRPVQRDFCHIILVKASPHLLMGRSVTVCDNLKSSYPPYSGGGGITFTQTTELLNRKDIREKTGQRLQTRLKGRLNLIVRGSGCLAKWTFSFNLRFSLCFCDNIINVSDAFSLGNMT